MKIKKTTRKHAQNKKFKIKKGSPYRYHVELIGDTYYSYDTQTGKYKKIKKIPKHHHKGMHKKHFKKHIEGGYHHQITKNDLNKSFKKIEEFAEKKAIPVLKKDYEEASKYTKEKVIPFIKKEAKQVGGFFKHLFEKKKEPEYDDSIPKVETSDEKINTSVGELETY